MWREFALWFTTIVSTVVLGTIACFLYENVYWSREAALSGSLGANPVFRLHILHLHAAMVKWSVGLFSGFSLVFLGLAVAFYHVRSRTQVGVKTPTFGVEAVSASPGVLAIVLGVALLMTTIASKNDFPLYEGNVPGAGARELVRPSAEALDLLQEDDRDEENANDGRSGD